jgi:signal transduction histidine kinase/CheY-like chemotaxis protein
MPDSTAQAALERRVLVLVSGKHESNLTQRLLREAGIFALCCDDVAALCEKLAEGAGAALLAEEVLSEPALHRVKQVLLGQPAWSDFPIVVFSANKQSDAMRAAVANALGNVTFLDRPVKVRTMVAAVHSALRSRLRQYEGRRAIESRDNFLAMLGHELRNPLGAITFATSALARKNVVEPRPSELGVLERQARHLARLVDELLDVARVTHGKVTLERQELNLADVAKGAFESFEHKAREQELSYRLDLPEVPVLVVGDRQRLEQVIGNLLANAIKYTPRGGRVTLALSVHQDSVSLSVTDTGVGLAPEMRERVFDPFAQVDHTLDRSQGGLGLGLALVHSIVALHGGSVKAESPGLGKGCCFEVQLPRATRRDVVDAPGETPAPDIHNMRVVLVEDNTDIRELFRELLQALGHQVAAAEDGPSGLQQLLAFRPDIAFVDVGLPGFDGYELARRARAFGSRARLVAMTGYGQREDKERAVSAGFDEHLVKPVQDEELRQAIARASC